MSSNNAALPRWLDTALVASSFLLYSFIAAPVPALNEPHYLAKAKRFWQPEWCAGDFFLESANAHTVFFVAVGWLTTFCSLTLTAVIGRIAALTVLAWGWTALARSLGLSLAGTLWSVWLFLALATIGNWSGEWLVGGVESKVFTYGCMLWAWSQLPEERWYRAALALGIGTAFHPVVGLWGLLATIGAAMWLYVLPPISPSPDLPIETSAARLKCAAQPSQLVIAALIVVVTALPGIVPVVALVLESANAATRYAGTYIQVYYRLGHHLDPMLFPMRAYAGYAVLAAVWLFGWAFGTRSAMAAWLHRLTAWSLVFALAGLAVGWGPRPPQLMPGFDWRMNLLKFYPFRLADALLPITVALWIAPVIAQRWLRPRAAVAGVLLLAAGTLSVALLKAQHRRYARAPDSDWREACLWVRDHTTRDSLVIAPHGRVSFKWYGERPEFTSFKDCPQDVRGIVEWNRRQLVLTRWYHAAFADDERYTGNELSELGELTGASYLIVDELGPVDAAPVYRNATHRVYDLRIATPTK